jgi:hypothetical protein
MQLQLKSTAIVTLVLLHSAVVHSQEIRVVPAAAAQAEQDARFQQNVQLLQPTLWKELDFVRQVCDLKPEQRPKIKAAADAAVQQAAKNMATVRQGQSSNSQGIGAKQAIRDGILQALKETLPPQAFAHYSEEAATRASAVKRATILSVAAKLDDALFLTVEQRDKIMAGLDGNWKDEWDQWQLVNQVVGQYLPSVPDQFVSPHLNPEQQTVWRGLQKINMSPWGNRNGRQQADDGWWEGKPEAPAKAKAKAKGKAAKAAH